MSVRTQPTEHRRLSSTTAERRRADRFDVEIDVTLGSPTARAGEKPIPAEGINRSSSGMLLIADKPLPAGTFHVLRIEGETPTEVRVMHCRRNMDDGRFDIGVAFC